MNKYPVSTRLHIREDGAGPVPRLGAGGLWGLARDHLTPDQWLPEPTVATVEATSSWYWLRDLLAQEQRPLTLAHAKFVKAIAYAKVKTDAVDALTLAQLLRADLIPRAHMVSPELRP